MTLDEIQKVLKERESKEVRKSIMKFVSTADKVYGVKSKVLNEILKNIKEPDFGLVEELWKSGAFEEKILAAKILGRICKGNPNKTLELVEKFSKDVSDWAVCDTLATQGIRKIVREKQKEIFELSKKLILSENFWQKRFAIVLLIELNRQGFNKTRIQKLAKKVENGKEHYVKKAIVWLKGELKDELK